MNYIPLSFSLHLSMQSLSLSLSFSIRRREEGGQPFVFFLRSQKERPKPLNPLQQLVCACVTSYEKPFKVLMKRCRLVFWRGIKEFSL